MFPQASSAALFVRLIRVTNIISLRVSRILSFVKLRARLALP